MPLEKRVISINFGQGLDQKTDAKLTAKLTTADNVVIRKNGTIEKRLGFVADGTWSISANPVKVFPFHNGEFVVTDQATDTISSTDSGYNHSIVNVSGSWFNNDIYSNIGAATRRMFTPTTGIKYSDLALVGMSATNSGTIMEMDLQVATFTTAGNISFHDIDKETTSTTQSAFQPIATPFRVCSATASSTQGFIATLQVSSIGLVRFDKNMTFTTSSLTLSPCVAPGFGDGNTQFDVASVNGKYYIFWRGTTNPLNLSVYDPAADTLSSTVVTYSGTASTIAIATPAAGTDRIRVMWCDNAAATSLFASYSLTLTPILSPTAVSLTAAARPPYGGIIQMDGVENVGATTWDLFYTSGPASATFPQSTFWAGTFSNTSASTFSTSALIGFTGCTLAAKPFTAHGASHIVVNWTATGSQSFIVLKAEKGAWYPYMRAVSRMLYGTAGPNFSASYAFLPHTVQGDAETFYTSLRKASYFTASNGQITVAYGSELIKLNASQTQCIPYVGNNGTELLGGGFLSLYDSNGIIENGFLTPPVLYTSSISTGGGSITTGTYSAVVVKEVLDRSGRMHRSSPSLPLTFTSSSTASSVTVKFYDGPTSRVSFARAGQIRYAIFRTAANGSIYYRDQTITSSNTAHGFNTVVTTDSILLTQSDATISGNDILYTQGGQLPNWTPDGVSAMCAHKSRVFCDDTSDQTIARYSKEISDDLGSGLAFFQSGSVFIPGAGQITGFASLDSTIIVFRNRAIYAVVGDGPDSTGLNGTFSDGQLIFDDIGCINQRNICRFRDGVVFKSPDKGFYFLSRDLQLQYVGADVESYNGKTVVSSEVVALQEASGTVEECRFLCSDGTLLTYNYYNQQWTSATLSGCVDAVQTGGRYVVVNTSSTAANARVFQQSLTTYTDAFSNTSTTYQMTVETGWIKTDQIQGFQRIWQGALIGESMGDGSISIEIGYDYESAYNEAHTVTMSSMTAANYTGGATAAAQMYFNVNRQKCEAVRFRIKDYPGATGAVMKLTNISLECGIKNNGIFRLPASKGA